MRAGLFVVASAAAAAIVLAAACSSFGGTDPVADAAAAPDTAPADTGVACNPPSSARSADVECTGDCTATPLVATGNAELAIVAGKGMYLVGQQQMTFSADFNVTKFAQLDQGPAILGTPLRMALDESNVYLATATENVRVGRGGGPKELLPLKKGVQSPAYFGTSAFFQLQPTHVIRTPKGGMESRDLEVVTTEALAVDGDTAYWIGQNAAGGHAIFGPFPETTERAAVTSPVLGFLLDGGFAYVAETAGAGSTISRIELATGRRTAVVNEPGRIDLLTLEGGKLYWLASTRLPRQGSRVFASVDPCADAPVTVLNKELPQLTGFVSFNATNAFAAPATAGPVYRMRK